MTTRSQLHGTTQVTLLFLHQRVNVWLRFGTPHAEMYLNRSRRIAIFNPGAIFCRVHWETNVYGTTLWRITVMQASDSSVPIQRIIGVQPGAQLLLEVEGAHRVQQVLQAIDDIEASGLSPQAVAPSFWRVLHNRLLTRQAVPRYTVARHAAWIKRCAVSDTLP